MLRSICGHADRPSQPSLSWCIRIVSRRGRQFALFVALLRQGSRSTRGNAKVQLIVNSFIQRVPLSNQAYWQIRLRHPDDEIIGGKTTGAFTLACTAFARAIARQILRFFSSASVHDHKRSANSSSVASLDRPLDNAPSGIKYLFLRVLSTTSGDVATYSDVYAPWGVDNANRDCMSHMTGRKKNPRSRMISVLTNPDGA